MFYLKMLNMFVKIFYFLVKYLLIMMYLWVFEVFCYSFFGIFLLDEFGSFIMILGIVS